MAHFAASDTKQKLPKIGENVSVEIAENDLQLSKLSVQSKLNCHENVERRAKYKLLELIEKFRLGFDISSVIDRNIEVLREYFSNVLEGPPEDLVIVIFEVFINNGNENCKCHGIIPSFKIKTVSFCRRVVTKSEKSDGPYFSFGTHAKEKDDFLVGYLDFSTIFGVIFLHDSKHKIACIVTNRRGCSLETLLNKIVMVKQYRIFTELYVQSDETNLEYIVFDADDVCTLNVKLSKTQHSPTLINEAPKNLERMHSFHFRLLSKSSMNISFQKESQCWLECKFYERSKEYEGFFVISFQCLQILPLLEIGKVYHVYHDKVVGTLHPELKRLRPNWPVFNINKKTAQFWHDSSLVLGDSLKENLLTVWEMFDEKCNTNLLSFQGVILLKKFSKPISSRTQTSFKCVGYGTPGIKTHILEFTGKDDRQKLTLYLNNWERLQIPLGLLPGMKVAVRNVIWQRASYLKSTALTTFEILSYEPSVFFETVNLCNKNDPNWGQPSFFGYGDLIPSNVLMWGRISTLYVRSLRIALGCSNCKIYLVQSGPCHTCKEGQGMLNLTMTLVATDEMGKFMIISKCLELLRVILNLELQEWKVWCQALESIGEYDYKKYADEVRTWKSESHIIFDEALTESLNVINWTAIISLDLKCRKLEPSKENNDGMPLWFCIDARKTII